MNVVFHKKESKRKKSEETIISKGIWKERKKTPLLYDIELPIINKVKHISWFLSGCKIYFKKC